MKIVFVHQIQNLPSIAFSFLKTLANQASYNRSKTMAGIFYVCIRYAIVELRIQRDEFY